MTNAKTDAVFKTIFWMRFPSLAFGPRAQNPFLNAVREKKQDFGTAGETARAAGLSYPKLIYG